MQSFIELGKKIYNLDNPREAHRFVVFVTRCCFNAGKIRKLDTFFQGNDVLRHIAEIYPFIYEQPTRAFFYNRSTFKERIKLVEEHMSFLVNKLKPEALVDLYSDKVYTLWEMDIDSEKLSLTLWYNPGQRKEGLLAVVLFLGDRELYQMIFWIAKDKFDEYALWIGAMQGPNMEDAREVIKKVTKRCHAYRTKNLILYATQAISRSLGLKKIYAVTNEGYYANNHIRIDRKLKTSFSDFWIEAGGNHTDDSRFDELPLMEERKTMEEVPTHKRAVYRRRFALLDEIDSSIETNMKNILLPEGNQ